MIDVREIYERVTRAREFRRMAEAEARRFAPTVDGGYIHKEYYTYERPQAAVQMLDRPVDLNQRLKHAMVERFSPPAEEPMLERKPMSNSFAPFALGGGVNVPVDYSQNIRLYENGLASIQLQTTGDYCEAAINFQDALAALPDFEKEQKQAKERAEREYMKEHPFDAEKVFSVTQVAKDTRIKARDEAVRKKKSLYDQKVSKAGKLAADQVVGSRNDRLTSSGLSDEVARLALNGSLDLESGTLWWYPTTLDLARMFKGSVKVPVKFFLAVDDNDSAAPEPEPGFSRDLLAESFNTAKSSGVAAFNDIRDSWHTKPGGLGLGRFPVVKQKRWEIMTKRLNAVRRPPRPSDPPDVFVGDDMMTWEGRTGAPAWMETRARDGTKRYNVLTIDGIRVIYKEPDGMPVTAFFMTPPALADMLREAVGHVPDKISVNMIRRTFRNMESLYEEASGMFGQTTGTRRYIP